METSNHDHHHDDEEASFIEMDPRLPPSKRFVRVSSDRFGFDLSATSLGFVHADEIISNSFLVPADTVKGSSSKEDCFIITTAGGVMNNPSSVSSLDHHRHRRNRRRSAFRRCKRLSTRFLERCFKCLMRPFSASKRRESTEFERDSTRMIVCKKSSVMAAADDKWRRSSDSESSIYEAVQHCKRSY